MLSRHSCNTRNLHIFIDALRRGSSLEMLRPISAFSFCVAKNLRVFRRGTFARGSGQDDDSEEKPFSGCTGWKR